MTKRPRSNRSRRHKQRQAGSGSPAAAESAVDRAAGGREPGDRPATRADRQPVLVMVKVPEFKGQLLGGTPGTFPVTIHVPTICLPVTFPCSVSTFWSGPGKSVVTLSVNCPVMFPFTSPEEINVADSPRNPLKQNTGPAKARLVTSTVVPLACASEALKL